MIALYIVLGIALLIFAILITKIRFFICYEDDLRVFARIWFLKFNIVPSKEKKPKAKKAKKKKAITESSEKKKDEKSIARKLWETRSILTKIISKFLGKLHFKFLKLRINIACDNAAKTALLYAGANQGVAYIIEILRNVSNVDVSTHSDVSVNANFISQKSEFEGKIELYIRVLPLISVGLHAIKEYVKFKSTKED